MKKKYFVRGLGVGIIFGALIMLAAYVSSGRGRMSDEDVIKRAEQLGMVQESEYVLNTESSETADDTTEAVTTTESAAEKQTTEATTTEKQTTEKTTTEKATTEATTTEKTITEATTTEKATTEADKPSSGTTKITVTGGMSSEAIAALLEDAELVDSATKFNAYLIEHGYDKKLETGSFTIEDGMSYAEIAKVLTTKN